MLLIGGICFLCVCFYYSGVQLEQCGGYQDVDLGVQCGVCGECLQGGICVQCDGDQYVGQYCLVVGDWQCDGEEYGVGCCQCIIFQDCGY